MDSRTDAVAQTVPSPGPVQTAAAGAVPLRIGTDCSGIGTVLLALRALGVAFRHVFASEIDIHARRTLQANHPAERVYSDLMLRDVNEVPRVDLYVAGFPCQSFSVAGLQQGFAARNGEGLMFFHILEYIQLRLPRAFILENVSGLLTVQGGTCFHVIWMALCGLAAYSVQWRVLNTSSSGIPQNRPRVFFIGVLASEATGTFDYPGLLPLLPLESFLEPRLGRPSFATLPPVSQSVARANVWRILNHLAASGHDPFNEPWVIDCDSSEERSRAFLGVSPCLTRSRGAGHWLTDRGRRMTVSEMLRLQGWFGSFNVVTSDRHFASLLGNAMSVNVLERLLVKLLPAAGLWPAELLVDRWAAGLAVAQRVE